MYFFVFFCSCLKIVIITYHAYSRFYKPFQTNFDSNVAIRTFEILPASKPAPQKTNFLKQRRAVTSRRRHRGVLSLRAADSGKTAFAKMLMAEVLTCSLQTESKGNFCLIIIYAHKNFPQPQNIHAKKQTFPNFYRHFAAFNEALDSHLT
jgi:hypothetical protein